MNRSSLQKAGRGILSPGFCCGLALLVTPSLSAQTLPRITDVTVTGITAFSRTALLAGSPIRAGEPLAPPTLQEDIERIKRLYVNDGYLQASFETSIRYNHDSSSAAVTIHVAEGKRFLVDSVYWSGAGVLSREELAQVAGLVPGDPLSSENMERGIQDVLRLCEARGYPLATIQVTNLVFHEEAEVHRVKMFLAVDEGPQARIEEVRIEGNTTTKDEVILRELRLDGDEMYTDAFASAIQRRLQRLELFSSVSRPEFYLTGSGAGGLLIRVREGTVNRFDGIVGYVPAAGQSGGGHVTGFVDVQLRNLFGTGRRLSTRWVRENPVTQDLALRYLEPWIAAWPVNAEAGFTQRKQDSTYVRRTYDIIVTVAVSEALTLGLTLDRANVFPADRPGNPVARSSIINAGGMVRYDGRDDPVTPQSGVLYSTSYEWGSKTVSVLGKESGDRTGRLTFDLEYYASPLARQVVAATLHGRDFQSSLIDQSDLFRLGGTTTLRGYREGQFLGSRILWSTLEYRLLTGRRSFVYGFLDAGYISQPDRASAGLVRTEMTRYGYGAGLRMDSGIGLIGMNLGFGKGDTFGTAKLHLRLINEF